MRSNTDWVERPPDRDGVRTVVYAVAFDPDGKHIVAAAGPRVVVYDLEGTPVQSLKGHTDAVYCVAYASNGQRFASGGGDCTVIIWAPDGRGLMKYSHKSTVQALAYNPITHTLASASEGDLGMWSEGVKSVPKKATSRRTLCMAWTHDGALLALGAVDGTVALRDAAGEVISEICPASECASNPVWGLACSPADVHGRSTLVAASWDKRLTFFEVAGQKAEVRTSQPYAKLAFQPTSICFSPGAQLLFVGGTSKQICLYTKEGVSVGTVATKAAWPWCLAARPDSGASSCQVVVGCEDGAVSLETISFPTVHGLHKESYAYRDGMTDVVIRPLDAAQRVRIKCREFVKNISVYKSIVAVQLGSDVVLYDHAGGDGGAAARYTVKARLPLTTQCDLLVASGEHVMTCRRNTLQLYSFTGTRVREWVLDANVKFVRCLGGPRGGEGVVACCRNGAVLVVYVDNAFPVQLWRHHTGVRCADVSPSLRHLALIDDDAQLKVLDLHTGATRFEEPRISSVAFNQQHEGMVAYSGAGMLSVRAGAFKPYRTRQSSLAVTFLGARVFCLSSLQLIEEDVPLSAPIRQYVDAHEWRAAYEVACLGASHDDWDALGRAALCELELRVARDAFVRTCDLLMLSLVARLESARLAGSPPDVLRGEALAYQGRFNAAEELFFKAGAAQQAVTMWSDLRRFDRATHCAQRAGDGSAALNALQAQQAQWSEAVRDYKAAAETYLSSGQPEKAIALLVQHSCDWCHLTDVARRLDRDRDANALQMAISALLKHGENEAAKEMIAKAQDWPALVRLYVDDGAWDDAFLAVQRCPAEQSTLYEAYGKHLAQCDRHDEARIAFAKAGRPHLASEILEQLVESSISQRLFADAAYYLYQAAIDASEVVQEKQRKMRARSAATVDIVRGTMLRAEIYYAYDIIHRSINTPFPITSRRVVFNAARFLFTRLRSAPVPEGVSESTFVFLLASNAEHLGALNIARAAYQRLMALKVPRHWHSRVEVASVAIRCRPRTDSEVLLERCARCSAHQPLLNAMGDVCPSCGMQIVRSFATFAALPLVQFELEAGITDDEAAELLAADPQHGRRTRGVHQGALCGLETQTDGVDMLVLHDDATSQEGVLSGPAKDEDPFMSQLVLPGRPIVANRAMLRSLTTSEVFVRKHLESVTPPEYFRLMDLFTDVVLGPCGHFFESDMYELCCIEKGCAPFSRSTANIGA